MFLNDTGNFYRQEAARLVADLSCSEYMYKVSNDCLNNLLSVSVFL